MKLILSGGGSGYQNRLVNEKLDEIIDHKKPILYIPLAMDEDVHSYDSCFEWITHELYNVSVPSIDMVHSFNELINKNYSNYSALYIGGGNTYKLLKGLKESGAFNKIKNYMNSDGIIIGGSAGAVIFGKDIDIVSVMDSNDVELEDTIGFDILNGISFFPHYTNKKSNLTEEENKLNLDKYTNSIKEFSTQNGEVIALPEEDSIFYTDSGYEIIGTRPYYLIKDGKIKKIEIE